MPSVGEGQATATTSRARIRAGRPPLMREEERKEERRLFLEERQHNPELQRQNRQQDLARQNRLVEGLLELSDPRLVDRLRAEM